MTTTTNDNDTRKTSHAIFGEMEFWAVCKPEVKNDLTRMHHGCRLPSGSCEAPAMAGDGPPSTANGDSYRQSPTEHYLRREARPKGCTRLSNRTLQETLNVPSHRADRPDHCPRHPAGSVGRIAVHLPVHLLLMPRLHLGHGEYCFVCLPKTAVEVIAARKMICLKRGSHRIVGKDPIVPHNHISLVLRECHDCGTLVADAANSTDTESRKVA